ncbi:MAG TPA: hypothetical protein VLH08_20855 [Acidobacteriota bacterium]|nr:hypothetical protein [Acidobacteriota bacterium]
MGGGLWVICQHPQSITTFNKKEQIVMLKRRGIFGRELREYQWKEIANIDVVEGNDDEGGVVYQLQMMMNNGETVPLTRVWAHSSPRYRKAAKTVREYLNIDETESHAIPHS